MIDHGNAVDFRLCPREAFGLILLILAVAAVIGGIAYYDRGSPGLVIAAFVGGICVGYYVLRYLLALIDRSVKLRIDVNGVHSAKLFVRSVPWSEISRVSFVKAPRGTLKMKVFGGGALNRPQPSAFDPLRDVFARGRINLEVEDLEGESGDIAAAIERFSPGTPVTW